MTELCSPEQQHANTHRLFIKLCWLMDKHAVATDRVVNIDETSIRSGGAAAASNKLSCRAKRKRPRHSVTVAFSKDRAPLDMLVQIVHTGKTDAVLLAQPWPERTHHVKNGCANTTTILQLAATLDDVMNPSKEGQSWILLWDIGHHPRWRPLSHRTVLPPATKHVVLAALRRGRLPQLQELHPDAGERHSCPLRPR